MHQNIPISSVIHSQHVRASYHVSKTPMNSIEESSAGKGQLCLLLLQVDQLVWPRTEDGQALELELVWKTKTVGFLEPHVLVKQTSQGAPWPPFDARLITGETN